MIKQHIHTMIEISKELQKFIEQDIEDVKLALHERLLERNDLKQEGMQKLVQMKQELNDMLVQAMQDGEDVNIYRAKVDELEEELNTLYALNGRLASIVLPVQQMYKDIVDELTEANGGSLVDIKA